VTSVELFFDLVFVFAVTQLSHGLMHHFSVHRAIEMGLLMLAVWWVWIFTGWVTNWLDPEQQPVRLMLLALMLAGLLLSASIPDAFDSRGLSFAVAYVLMQVGRTAFAVWAIGPGHEGLRLNFQRILAWLAVSGVFWLAGGLASGAWRLSLWAMAVAIEYAGPWVRFYVPKLGSTPTSEWDVEGGHLAERCGLFVIIALGESILVTGATASDLDWTIPNVMAFLGSFAGSLAMWWIYFDISAEAGSHRIQHSGDPGRFARLAYTYFHLPIVAGIILSAVADEFVLKHPTGDLETGTKAAVLGAAGVYLLGNLLFKWAVWRVFPSSHALAIAMCAVLWLTPESIAPWVFNLLVAGILIGVARWETRQEAIRCEAEFSGPEPHLK
jgi:low temperature requirement protein LtrA